MKTAIYAAAAAIAVQGSALPSLSKVARADDLPEVPSGCMTSYNGIHFGWLPDDASNGAVSMAVLHADTGKPGCFFGDYSHISSTSYDGSDITGKTGITDGAVMVPSIMPTGVTWDQVDSTLANKIGTAVKAFTNKGIPVYLRFAHEVNCYGKPGCASPPYPGGTDYAAFKQAWAKVASVCRSIEHCYMYFCPNQNGDDDIKNWLPAAEDIDIMGIDHYISASASGSTFASQFGSFYTEYVEPYGKPFLIGETACSGCSEDQKNAWVKTLTMSDFGAYPLYKGVMWFEYNKESNFYVVYGHTKAEIDKFDANFAQGAIICLLMIAEALGYYISEIPLRPCVP
ncbi:glycoside hydrolase superfamily [Xylariomycetidae sp. FL2044]|nr:glycoside hydrolase superfamily [Xylariomycetidae sp. FL2044]